MNDILQKLLPPFVTKADTGSATNLAGATPLFNIFVDRRKVNVAKALEAYKNWVYACVRAIAEELAAIQWKEMQGDKEVEGTDMLDTLAVPNETQTGYQLMYRTAAQLELCGNAYWYLDGVKGPLDKPLGIYLLDVDKIKILKTKGVFPARLLGYRYNHEGRDYTYEPYQVLHLSCPDPSNEFEGLGTVQAIATWVDADNYAMEVNRRFFLNGARIGGFLESEKANTPSQLAYLKKSFEEIYKGVENAYKIAALPKGVKFTAGSLAPKDMDFSNLGDQMMKRILAGFRVPKSVLGITEDVNRANAEASNYIFALRTIKPKVEALKATLNAFYAPRFGKTNSLTYVDPVPENEEMKINRLRAVTGNQPIISVNEARAEYENREPVENGDEVMQGRGMVPLGTPPMSYSLGGPGSNVNADNAPTDAPAGKTQPRAENKAQVEVKKAVLKQQPTEKPAAAKAQSMWHRRAKSIQANNEVIAAKALEAYEAMLDKEKEIRAKKLKDITAADWGVLWKAFAERTGKSEALVAEAMQKLNAAQAETVRGNLETAVKSVQLNKKGIITKGVEKSSLLDYDNEVRATVELVEPIITDVYQNEGNQAAQLVGADDVNLPTQDKIKEAIRRRMELMAESYTETTLDQLASKLDAGIAQGATMDELSDMVSETYADWDGWRADMVARTETFAAANSATKEAWAETGVVKTLKWYTAEDEMVCPWCEVMADVTIDISADFFAKGDTVTGSNGKEMTLDYDDVGAPPLHAGCRCYIRPDEISIED